MSALHTLTTSLSCLPACPPLSSHSVPSVCLATTPMLSVSLEGRSVLCISHLSCWNGSLLAGRKACFHTYFCGLSSRKELWAQAISASAFLTSASGEQHTLYLTMCYNGQMSTCAHAFIGFELSCKFASCILLRGPSVCAALGVCVCVCVYNHVSFNATHHTPRLGQVLRRV